MAIWLIAQSLAGILFNFESYLELVHRTRRIIRSDKRGHIADRLPPILARLGISPAQWRLDITAFEALHPERLKPASQLLDTG